jgi:hypothetical protein
MVTIQLVVSVAFVAAVFCGASPLTAQGIGSSEPRPEASTEPRLRCWRGQPAPACRSFVISELGYARALAGTSSTYSQVPYGSRDSTYRARDFSDHAFFEIGGMHNRGPSTALGATLMLGADATGPRFGAKARYRRWLTADGRSLDVGAGVIVGNLPKVSRTLTLTGDVALNFSDYGALVTGVEVARPNGRPRAALFGGARLGSKPGTIGIAAAMLFAAIGAVALASWSWE